jgi:cell division protein FtsB
MIENPQKAGPKQPQLTFAEQWRDFFHRNLNWFLVAGLAVLLLQDVFGTHGVLAMRRSMQEAQQVQQEINRLNAENQQLQDNVQRLKSDPAAIEKIAREDMGLARPGEYIFKIAPKQPATSSPAQTANPHPPGPRKKP